MFLPVAPESTAVGCFFGDWGHQDTYRVPPLSILPPLRFPLNEGYMLQCLSGLYAASISAGRVLASPGPEVKHEIRE